MKSITQDEIDSFVQFLFEEACDIKDYGHSLCYNHHESNEIKETINKIKLLLEDIDTYIIESYEL